MHDIPYSFFVGPEVCASMTAVCAAVRSICPFLPLGVQILSSANQQAMAVALASGPCFTSVWLLFCCKWSLNLCSQRQIQNRGLQSRVHQSENRFSYQTADSLCVYQWNVVNCSIYNVTILSQVWISSGLRVLSFLTWLTRASWTPAQGTYWDIASRLEPSMYRSSPTSRRSTGEIIICTVWLRKENLMSHWYAKKTWQHIWDFILLNTTVVVHLELLFPLMILT